MFNWRHILPSDVQSESSKAICLTGLDCTLTLAKWKSCMSMPVLPAVGSVKRSVFRLDSSAVLALLGNFHVTQSQLTALPLCLLPPGLWSPVPNCTHCTALSLTISGPSTLLFSAAPFRFDWISEATSSSSWVFYRDKERKNLLSVIYAVIISLLCAAFCQDW